LNAFFLQTHFIQRGSVKESQPEDNSKIFQHVSGAYKLVEKRQGNKKLAGYQEEKKRYKKQ
jgi:hypothetical protein